MKEGDVILLTEMEHHSNLVPWQLVAQRTGATLRFLPVLGANVEGGLDLAQLAALLTPAVKLFAFTHVSNTTGTINPAAELCAASRARGGARGPVGGVWGGGGTGSRLRVRWGPGVGRRRRGS